MRGNNCQCRELLLELWKIPQITQRIIVYFSLDILGWVLQTAGVSSPLARVY